tara:strand:+ start:23619 stop:24464 length:846 start_codon:yes stop_codon:yes gene_type:complete
MEKIKDNNDKIDNKVIEDFGLEWNEYNHETYSENENLARFDEYFNIFPFELINENSIGFDAGAGTGRWAKIFSNKVKKLYCIEPSKAINVCKSNLKNKKNCNFLNIKIEDFDAQESSMDFGYCIGVLHHISHTQIAINHCVSKLKKGSPFLVYIYYNFDNKPYWFYLIWKVSNLLRLLISKLNFKNKLIISKILAYLVYLPLARLSKLLENIGLNVENIPLSYYRNTNFYTMKTDSLDKFGTKLEKRFSRKEIELMMMNSGLKDINFSPKKPYWVAVGIKK